MRSVTIGRSASFAMLALTAGAAAPLATPTIVLDGSGFATGGQRASFGRTARTQALALAAKSLGKPIERGSHGQCANTDTIDYAKFRGDFELSFVRGRLTGWTADGPKPLTSRGIGVGMRLAALRTVYPDIYVDPGDEKHGGLGPSFKREGGPHGWLGGTRPRDKIMGLFAGETCLMGV